jgi:hypothetical protein
MLAGKTPTTTKGQAMGNEVYNKRVDLDRDAAKDAVIRISIEGDELIEIVFIEDGESLFYRIVELTDDDAYEHCIENTLPEYWDRF